MQISESQCARAIRTEKYKYSVRSAAIEGFTTYKASVYFEDYLYDLEKDPNEKVNLVTKREYKAARAELRKLLIKQMTEIGEKKPLILPALFARKK